MSEVEIKSFSNEFLKDCIEMYETIQDCMSANVGDDQETCNNAVFVFNSGEKFYVSFCSRSNPIHFHIERQINYKGNNINATAIFTINRRTMVGDSARVNIYEGDNFWNYDISYWTSEKKKEFNYELTDDIVNIIQEYVKLAKEAVSMVKYDKEATHATTNLNTEGKRRYANNYLNALKMTKQDVEWLPAVEFAVNYWLNKYYFRFVPEKDRDYEKIEEFKIILARKIMAKLLDGELVFLESKDNSDDKTLEEAINETGLFYTFNPTKAPYFWMTVGPDYVNVFDKVEFEYTPIADYTEREKQPELQDAIGNIGNKPTI